MAGSPSGRQENTISTHRRLAAGLCALSIVVLTTGFGSAVALADSETGESQEPAKTGTTAGTFGTGTQDTVPQLIGTVFDTGPQISTDHEATNSETNSVPSGMTGPMALSTTTDSQSGAAAAAADDNKSSDTVSTAGTQDSNEPQTAVSSSPAADTTSQSQTANGDGSSLTNAEVSSLSNSDASSTTNADASPPASDPPQEQVVQAAAVAQPAADQTSLVGEAAPSVQADPPPPVVGAAQANNVIISLASFFISLAVDGIHQLLKLPGDVLSMLGIPLTGDVPTASLTAGGIGGSLFAAGLNAATPAELASSLAVQAGWPAMLIAPGGSGPLATFGLLTHRTPGGLAASGAAREHAGLTAKLADGIAPEGVRSLLQHAVDAFLAPLSLLALAALASPGVAGLVLFSAAGMFFGYRQARAASMLQAVGIARFVKAGPLGVVRGGGLITVPARSSRTGRHQAPRTRDFLRPVA
jgi:hypothetical protein